MKKWLTGFLLALAFLCALAAPASAKTISSARSDHVFFYAENAAGKSVLLKVMSLSELKKLSHGQPDGSDYSISATDNYPTTQYCEARGFTVGELLDYVKSVTAVQGASALTYTGGDTLRLMATDGYGNYSRSWTCNQLYGVKRYYFEGLYDSSKGWNTGWEIAGEDNSKFGVTLDEYNRTYKDSDPYYANKRAVFAGGIETVPILATESYSGRTASETLAASAEAGLASYIRANGGIVAGCLKSVLTDACALRLSLPMTEADLMAAHRTAYDNFKWIYNLQLSMTDAPHMASLGTVAEPVPSFRLSGNTLTISFSCATGGASIYYGSDGAPQTRYTEPITLDVTGRDLTSDPVAIYVTAVKEGYDDAGVLTFQYPGMAPSFQTIYSGMTGADLTFTAAAGVSSADWSAWTDAMNFVSMKTPSGEGYATLGKSSYSFHNSAGTVTFEKSLFTEAGSYSFIFHAAKYANKGVSVTMKKSAPPLSCAGSFAFGSPVGISFGDADYSNGLSVYVTPEGGARTLVSSSYLDKTMFGQVSIKASYFTAASTAMPGAGTYTLELVNNNYSPAAQTVAVTLTREGTGFTDVTSDDWYAPAVAYVTGAGLFNGTGTATFSPGVPMTRAMFVTVLARMAGVPTGSGMATEFSDVPEDCWCSASVAWAVKNNIVTGYADGRFDPAGRITREQIAAILYRYVKSAGADVTASGTVSAFPDSAQISSWAQEPLAWAVGEKIIGGYADGRVDPKGTATRAQVAQILSNYGRRKGAGD